MIKVSVFDFDGTIANTIPVTLSIFKKFAMKDFKTKLDDRLIDELRDKPIPEIFKALNISIIKLPYIARRTRQELNKEIAKLKPVDGIKSLLNDLKGQGQVLGIVSSNSQESIGKFLEKNDMGMFDFVYTSSSVFGKSGGLKKVLKDYYNYGKNNIVYFGDEIRDIEAARKVGIRIASVTWGVNSREKLAAYNPDFLIDSPSELPAIFNSERVRVAGK
jgi:HAD superfamily hydrolase (TIGR01549 family)